MTLIHRTTLLSTALLFGSLLSACGPDRPQTSPRQRIRAALASDSVVHLTTGDTVGLGKPTRAFYRGRRYRAAWVKDGKLTDQGEALYRALGNSWQDGLSPDQYRFDAAVAARKRLALAEEQDSLKPQVPRLLGDLDLLLTEGMNRYSNDLAQGALDPKQSGLDWRIARERAPEASILDALVKGRSVAEVVANLRPRDVQYRRFMQALVRYEDLQRRGAQWPAVPQDVSLKPGQSGATVLLLRRRMTYSPDPLEAKLASTAGTPPDKYDDQLAQAVKHFQERHGIDPDGALGPTTVAELNRPLSERIDELRLNMDRWRWLPHDLGMRYVLVNVAGFELEVVENGRVIDEMNVVVGQEGWNTPIFADTMEDIVVNPSWNVPKSIFEEEIRPAMQRDPNYLAKNNMEMDPDGSVRQLPGADNALGKLKFMFPNKDNIYLHDTPAKHLFSLTRRDYSHGCIRVERPEELARLILSRTTRDSSALEPALASSQEKWLKFDHKLPIYILYFTAWVNPDGTVRFHHDVYGRDKQLEQQRERELT